MKQQKREIVFEAKQMAWLQKIDAADRIQLHSLIRKKLRESECPKYTAEQYRTVAKILEIG